jgi:uncharacterized protein with von Willebrand factor type A (vWA) domain
MRDMALAVSQAIKSDFENFIKFCSIADYDTREELSETIFESLQKEDFDNIGFSNSKINNFADAINNILSYDTMRELCSADSELSGQVTQSILDFIRNTHRQIQKTENPFEAERQLLDEFKGAERKDFGKSWNDAAPFIRKTYDQEVFDTDFYHKEFQNSLNPGMLKDKSDTKRKTVSFQSVKEHFTEKWEKLLTQKQIQWELEQIEKERKKFCEELYKQIEELKKLQEILEPFVGRISGLWGMGMGMGMGMNPNSSGRGRGRGWDMGKGSFQRAGFDILKRYAELLQKDTSLQELAEMLGRMQAAEAEYEDEIFTDKVMRPEWKVEHASKADLVGIHESDDISSMLPAEAALLSDPLLETVFYKKFAEKKLQTFDYQAKILSYREEEFQNKRQKAKEGKKGPIIICVDTSGSMHGTPEQVAKTLSFALLKIAIRENRKCYLISFSTGIETLELTNIRGNLDKLLDFLSMSFYGGTDATPALNEALRMLETEDYKKSDVVMVSDFIMGGLGGIQEKIRAAKEKKTKFHSLVIGNSGNKQAIEEFDSNWVYNPSDPNRVISLVRNIRENI